jgi:hypothetical protein
MDRKLPENPEIQRLIELSENCRRFLENEATHLRQKLDIPSRVRDSLRESPTKWLAGSLASGFAASLLFRGRPAPATKRRGIPATLLGLTLTAARPLLKVWLANQVKQVVTGNSSILVPGPMRHKPASTSNTF